MMNEIFNYDVIINNSFKPYFITKDIKSYVMECIKNETIQSKRSFEDNSYQSNDIVAILEVHDGTIANLIYWHLYFVQKWHRMSDKFAEYTLYSPGCGRNIFNPRNIEQINPHGVKYKLYYKWVPNLVQLINMTDIFLKGGFKEEDFLLGGINLK